MDGFRAQGRPVGQWQEDRDYLYTTCLYRNLAVGNHGAEGGFTKGLEGGSKKRGIETLERRRKLIYNATLLKPPKETQYS